MFIEYNKGGTVSFINLTHIHAIKYSEAPKGRQHITLLGQPIKVDAQSTEFQDVYAHSILEVLEFDNIDLARDFMVDFRKRFSNYTVHSRTGIAVDTNFDPRELVKKIGAFGSPSQKDRHG